jgi:hypothetical protein
MTREKLLRDISRVRRLLPQFQGTPVGEGLQSVLKEKEQDLWWLDLVAHLQEKVKPAYKETEPGDLEGSLLCRHCANAGEILPGHDDCYF